MVLIWVRTISGVCTISAGSTWQNTPRFGTCQCPFPDCQELVSERFPPRLRKPIFIIVLSNGESINGCLKIYRVRELWVLGLYCCVVRPQIIWDNNRHFGRRCFFPLRITHTFCKYSFDLFCQDFRIAILISDGVNMDRPGEHWSIQGRFEITRKIEAWPWGVAVYNAPIGYSTEWGVTKRSSAGPTRLRAFLELPRNIL